ncbi:MAG: hypothetical protein KDK38_00815 [Leptospiraceae bacterium]|nr:hypothetical protein [Leptospiraceae bacterium]
MVFTASLFSALLYSLIIMFQLCLVAGKQWGHLAWGGLHKGKLPKKLRIASAISVLILLGFGSVNLHTAGMIDLKRISFPVHTFQWIITVYAITGTLMNAFSRSKPERYLWTPVAFAIAVLNALILVYFDFE